MFQLLPVALLAVALAVQAAGSPSPLDRPVPGRYRVTGPAAYGECQFIQSLEEALRPTPLRLGFENLSECGPSGWVMHNAEVAARRAAIGDFTLSNAELDFDGRTPRQALDTLIQMRPEFSWREVDGVVVVRPVTAWADPANLLHRRVSAFTIEETHMHYVLHALTEAAQPPVMMPHVEVNLSSTLRRYRDPSATSPIDQPVTVSFAGGTMLDALNIAAGSADAFWQVGYPNPGPIAHIGVHLRDMPDGSVLIPVRIGR